MRLSFAFFIALVLTFTASTAFAANVGMDRNCFLMAERAVLAAYPNWKLVNSLELSSGEVVEGAISYWMNQLQFDLDDGSQTHNILVVVYQKSNVPCFVRNIIAVKP